MAAIATSQLTFCHRLHLDKLLAALLYPWRQLLDRWEIKDAAIARLICKLIPSQCPFARDIRILGRTLLRIPPLCKLNPLYDDLMNLRFRALTYLADICGEDISNYCS